MMISKWMRYKRLAGAAMIAAAALVMQPMDMASAAELSIQEAVDLAIAQNTSLRITEKGEETARAELKSARGQNSFEVTGSGNVTDSKVNDNRNTGSGGASLSVGLPVYTGGKNEANIKSAEIGVDAARLTTERARENLRLSVVKAYYDVLESKRTVDIDQESVDNYQAHLDNVEQLYRAGSKAKLDVLRSSVELANARQTLIKAQSDYNVNVVTLKNLLRMDQNEPLTLTEDFKFTPFHPRMEACLGYAFINRKDLIVDQYTLRQKELAIDMAKAGYLPSISISASAGTSQDFYPHEDNSHNYSVGAKLSWSIFDSGVTDAAVDRAKTARDVAQLTLDKDKEDIDLGVRQAYYNMREAQRRLMTTQAAVREAEEDYFITREKYRAGQGIMLDIIDAQLALSTAQLNYISAEYDYARYMATVENEMGLSLGESPNVADEEHAAEMESRIAAHGGLPEDAPPARDYRNAEVIVGDREPDEDRRPKESETEAAKEASSEAENAAESGANENGEEDNNSKNEVTP
ncbi:MAG: TolC family protein [Selenomonadaceae bacterium]